MHIFVTGGTGFFGKALLRHWASGSSQELNGARFTLLSRDPARFKAAHGALLKDLDVRLVAGDIQRAYTLPNQGGFTHILHAATDSTAGLSLTPLQRFEQIVEGTRNVLDMAVRQGVKRVLLTSSGGVYGPQPANLAMIPEDWNGMPDPLNAHNAYSVAKRVAEHLAALYQDAHGVDTVVARCFAFIGQDLPVNAHFAIGNFIRDAVAGTDIVIQGDGTPIRSYLDQRDLAHWLMTLLLRGTAQRAYNVGSDQVISIADLAKLVARLAGGRSDVRVLGKLPPGQSAQRNRYVPDLYRIREELGLTIQHELPDAIRDTLAALSRAAPLHRHDA
jgi:UDP-glucuronate decarboxylase